MRLSDVHPDEVEVESSSPPSGGMKLSQIDPASIETDSGPPTPAASQDRNGLYATPDHKMRSVKDVNWLDAIKNEFTKPLDPSAKSFIGNPMIQSLAGEAASPLIGAAGKALGGAAEGFATSPIPQKLSDATNIVGKGKGLVSKLTGQFGDAFGETGQKVADAVSGAIGRKAAYSFPLSGATQGVSDAAKGVTYAQKGVAWLLDHAPEALDKFAPVLKNIRQTSGAAGLATANFLLQQSNPDYQAIMKKHQDGQ